MNEEDPLAGCTVIDLSGHRGTMVIRGGDPRMPGIATHRRCLDCGAPATHVEEITRPHTTVTLKGLAFIQDAKERFYCCAEHTGFEG